MRLEHADHLAQVRRLERHPRPGHVHALGALDAHAAPLGAQLEVSLGHVEDHRAVAPDLDEQAAADVPDREHLALWAGLDGGHDPGRSAQLERRPVVRGADSIRACPRPARWRAWRQNSTGSGRGPR
ncbi:MAG: hypothetical protein M5U28_08265 [Sandaracinaceae bacterium]|nr:hypothetical protein [Sandaracinaceae bacterium]